MGFRSDWMNNFPKKWLSKTARVLRVVVTARLPHHCTNIWKMLLQHYSCEAKKSVLPFAEKPPQAKTFYRSFGIRRVGRSLYTTGFTVLRKSWKAVSSVKTVLFQLSFRWVCAHSTRLRFCSSAFLIDDDLVYQCLHQKSKNANQKIILIWEDIRVQSVSTFFAIFFVTH